MSVRYNFLVPQVIMVFLVLGSLELAGLMPGPDSAWGEDKIQGSGLPGRWEGRTEPFSARATLGKSLIEPGRIQVDFLKVGITGTPSTVSRPRPPLNIGIVLDCSGSMVGKKIEDAKAAALFAISQLGPNDSFSLVTFDTVARVVIPSGKPDVFTEGTRSMIRAIQPNNCTNLFDGLLLGASEVKKQWGTGRVNRLILLSDGMANVGPSSTSDIASLGQSLARAGISVTTLGIGRDYNQELLTRLALMSEGNHAFIRETEELTGIFVREFGDLLQVAATDISITVTCQGMKPVRALGREGVISGQSITLSLNQVYGNQEKYLLLEVEIPASASQENPPSADISFSGFDPISGKTVVLAGKVGVGFSNDSQELAKGRDEETEATAFSHQTDLEYRKAMDEIAKGEIDKARQTIAMNLENIARGKASYANMRVILGAVEMYNMDAVETLAPQSMTPAQREELLKAMSENLHRGASQQNW
ncbi:MAG: VWA domain-containing protein [Candidatus Ozemobacteraceae bacterium]